MVILSHVVEDAWQGQLETQYESITHGTITLLPDTYFFEWAAMDVKGIPIVWTSGWFTFVDESTITIVPISIGSTSNGITLPISGNYNFAKFHPLCVYAFPEDGYRLANWLVNNNEGDAVNPLAVAITPAFSSVQAVFESNAHPFADFTISKTEAEIDETLTFDASSCYDIDGWIEVWSWDFGDASVGEGETVHHSYGVENVYKVTLTVTDNDGATNSLEQFVTITAGQEPTPTTYVFTVEASVGGVTSPLPDTYEVEEGTKITVLSFPDSGYVLEYWLVDGLQVDPSETVTVIVNQDTSVKAQFIEIGYEQDWEWEGFDVPTPATFNLPIFVLGAVLVGAGFMFRRRKKN